MLIYGSRAVHLKSVQSQTATCPSCNTKGSLVLSVFSKHAHIFWIPLFPFGKKGVSECTHCKNVLENKEMPDDIKKEYNNLKAEVKAPIWQFVGLAVIGALIAWGIVISGEDKKKELTYIAKPLVGDIYEYKIKTKTYSTLKVVNVSADSVFVSPNQYEISKMTRMYKIDKPENYAKFSYGIAKSKLKEMHDSGKIFDIKR